MQNICDQKPKVRYLVALDDSKVKLKQITKAVGKHLGTGKIKPVLKEDALLNKEISSNVNKNKIKINKFQANRILRFQNLLIKHHPD